jgi:hypothetical protein
MFMLNDRPLAVDTPFTHNGIQYPANWLRLSSASEKAAIGITEVADPVPHDDRFYWAPGVPKTLEDRAEVDKDGNPMLDADGKQIVTKGLKSTMIAQIKVTAGSLLSQTDWMVIRKAERNVEIPASIAAYRAAVVAAADANEAAISACASVEALAALQLNWPKE